MADPLIEGTNPFALIDFARSLAAAARAETLPRWLSGCAAENKAGRGQYDPVTDADRQAEQAMRRLIESHYPDHGIEGEEYAARPGSGTYAWSLDPVDGTRAFVCGLPSWTTLVALLEERQPLLGLIDAPALDELYVGCAETAVLTRGGETRMIRASGCPSLKEARLSTTDPELFGSGEQAVFAALRDRARITRYGLDGYAYARLAAGSLDLVVEAGLKPHDYNALVPLVRAAGGLIGDWRGGARFEQGKIVAAATPALMDEALAVLSRV